MGRSTYHWNQVRQCFDQCCRKLKKALEDQPDPAMRGGTLLGQILQVHHDLLLYRYVSQVKKKRTTIQPYIRELPSWLPTPNP